MAKFKFKFKLTGLEVEMEGDRQDAPQITAAIANQLGSLIMPAASTLHEASPHDRKPALEIDVGKREEPSKKRKSTHRPPKSASTADANAEAPDLTHDVESWGSPSQTWTTGKKAIWLLYIVSRQTSEAELSAGAVASLFNTHFRQAGEIRPSNVSRDLGNLKTKAKPPQVGERTASSPSKWYLTNEGLKEAEKLVVELVGKLPG